MDIKQWDPSVVYHILDDSDPFVLYSMGCWHSKEDRWFYHYLEMLLRVTWLGLHVHQMAHRQRRPIATFKRCAVCVHVMIQHLDVMNSDSPLAYTHAVCG
jgi:uncharacterized membrane protein YbaN (DUF454 family)